MNLDAVNLQNSPQAQLRTVSDEVTEARKKKEQSANEEQVEKKQVQPEEMLEKIKSLTEDGLYSVRFESSERDAGQLVVKIVDQETDEVIRQVPAEEILDLRQALDDLRGNLVDTQG